MWPKKNDPLDLLRNALDRWDKKEQVGTFSFRRITTLETSQLVAKLGNLVAYGHNGIDSLSLKLILPQIIIPLTHLVNTSLMQNKFAMKWKLSKVVPLLNDKSSCKLDPNEYRPVSLLSSTSKIVGEGRSSCSS